MVVAERESVVVVESSDVSSPSRRVFLSTAMAIAAVAATGASVRGQEASPVADRLVVDRMGPVTVPGRPQRVIAEGNSTLGNMIALGVKPVGASMNANSLPFFLADQIDGVVDVRAEDASVDIEKALTLNPDLLIALWGVRDTGYWEENVKRYKRAMTTFCYEQNYVYEEDIKQNVLDIAVALGVEDRAEAVLAAYDERVADMRQAVIDAGFTDKPVSVVRLMASGTYYLCIGTSESIAFRAIGIPRPEGQQNPEEFAIELSLERLDILNSAYALVIYIDDNSSVTQDDLLSDELWQSITAVRENRVIFVSSGVWNSIEILGVMAIIDDIETLLLPLAQAR